MSKIIIYNDSTLNDTVALDYVKTVIWGGRISDHGKSYCSCTVFGKGRWNVTVYATKSKKSDVFRVTKKGEK